jgi:glucans biosynthesis protein
MHGGAPGSGAPPGNKNALKHGRFTREKKAERRRVRELLRQSRKMLTDIMQSHETHTDNIK